MRFSLISILSLIFSQLSAAGPNIVMISPNPPSVTVNLPEVGLSQILDGYTEEDPSSRKAINVKVVKGNPKLPWKLYIRAKNESFTPLAQNKPHYHASWKHNDENSNQYRALSTNESLVYDQPNGNTVNSIPLDIRVSVDWTDPPTNPEYNLELELILKTTP